MRDILLPQKINFENGKNENEVIISIQPCSPGYGTTLGNALRRVLLSSLPGTAATAFKIKGVSHEFSTIPNIKEDLIEVSLNLKLLRFKMIGDEPTRLTLKVKGEKKVMAKDIKVPANVEVVNPNLHIATLTSLEAELEMEIIVNKGRGYLSTEDREKEELEVGMIAVDAIFTPVKNVGFKIENIRVDQMTNYENLIINLETDGTITPKETLNLANKILLDHFNFIEKELLGVSTEEKEEKVAAKEKELEEKGGEVVKETKEKEEKEEKPRKRGRPRKTEVKNE